MPSRTADEARAANIGAMGEVLGSLYSALWQSTAQIYYYWHEYVELFGTSPERIELLNHAAPSFFRMLQDELWENSLLHLARLTDPANSMGRRDRANLTVRALPDLIADTGLKQEVIRLIEHAIVQTEFCCDWRNRRIAHRDLKLALEQPTKALAMGCRSRFKAALDAIAAVLNAVEYFYFESETRFDVGRAVGGANSIIYFLDLGLKAVDRGDPR